MELVVAAVGVVSMVSGLRWRQFSGVELTSCDCRASEGGCGGGGLSLFGGWSWGGDVALGKGTCSQGVGFGRDSGLSVRRSSPLA